MRTWRTLLLPVVLYLTPIGVRAQTAGTCTIGSATTDLDIGGVRARLYNNGGLFWKGAGNVYNVPKTLSSVITPNAVFAQSIWLGGYVNGELRQAGASYSRWEFYPGPPLADGSAPSNCAVNDRIWRVSVDDVRAYDRTGVATRDMIEWPFGNGAPVKDGDGVAGNYNLAGGDRPDVLGHQIAFWVMNDVGGPHQQTGSKPMGVEVRVTAIAFRSPSEALHYSTAYRYEIINRGSAPITETYFGLWTDTDLGNATDDYIGSDSTLRMGYTYNGDNFDEGSDGYGTPPPALGYKLVQGPLVEDTNHDGSPDASGFTSLLYYQGASSINGNPRSNTDDYYDFMQAHWTDGSPMRACGDGYNSTTECPVTHWIYSGDPTAPPGQRFWSEFEPRRGTSSPNALSDRRFVMGSGPFTLEPGVPQTFTLAMVWARGASNLDSVTRLKQAAREVQAAYDATGFRNLPERAIPDAPSALPRLIGPANGATGQPGNLLLTWEPVAGATAYEVEVTGAGGEPVSVSRVLETSVRVPYRPFADLQNTDILPNGTYNWRVRGVNEGGPGGWSSLYRFVVEAPPVLIGGYKDFLTTRNAAGPINPPRYGAIDANARGFPHPSTADPVPGAGQQSTNASQWGFHTADTDASDGGFAYFYSRTTRDGANLGAIGASDYEMRFTAAGGKAIDWFASGCVYDVPFELWDVGTKADASDDVRMVPFINPISGGQDCKFDLGADHPTSGGTNDPQTDWVYWYRPEDVTPGQAGYNKWVNAATTLGAAYNGEEVHEEVFARIVLVNFNGGNVPGPFNANLPETGTVFRIVMAPLSAPILSAPAEGETLETRNVLLAWQEPPQGITLRRFVEVATDSAFTHVVVRDSSATAAQWRTPALVSGQHYYWRVQLLMNSIADATTGARSSWSATGTFTAGSVVGVDGAEPMPDVLTLRSLAPNPTHGAVTLGYGLPAPADVRVRLFDLLGREAAVHTLGPQAAGWHRVPFGTETLAAGVYVVRLEAGGSAVTRPIVVTR